GYAGNGGANPDAHDVAAHPTILSGDIGTVGLSTDNAFHVLSLGATSFATLVDGFTIKAGHANGNPALNEDAGGGLIILGGSPVLGHCTFDGNQADAAGGAVSSAAAEAEFTHCTFTNNVSAYMWGGGVSGSGEFVDCSFAGNKT